ncbi:hypothetical protein J2T59_001474 [Methanosalsum natronophilum]|nr:hypothetical protein [Methanosalsum natronophilum]
MEPLILLLFQNEKYLFYLLIAFYIKVKALKVDDKNKFF